MKTAYRSDDWNKTVTVPLCKEKYFFKKWRSTHKVLILLMQAFGRIKKMQGMTISKIWEVECGFTRGRGWTDQAHKVASGVIKFASCNENILFLAIIKVFNANGLSLLLFRVGSAHILIIHTLKPSSPKSSELYCKFPVPVQVSFFS